MPRTYIRKDGNVSTLSAAEYVRRSRRLAHQQDGLFFQGAHRPGSPLAAQLEAVEEAMRANRAEYNGVPA